MDITQQHILKIPIAFILLDKDRHFILIFKKNISVSSTARQTRCHSRYRFQLENLETRPSSYNFFCQNFCNFLAFYRPTSSGFTRKMYRTQGTVFKVGFFVLTFVLTATFVAVDWTVIPKEDLTKNVRQNHQLTSGELNVSCKRIYAV